MLRIVSAMAIGMAFAGPVAADVDLSAATACFDAGGAWSKQAIKCIETAHLPCLGNAVETPAVATLCFQKARTTWSEALAAEIQSLSTQSNQRIKDIITINAKYDTLIGLLHCDRSEELAQRTSAAAGPEIALQKARCLSNAAASTYMSVYFKSAEFSERQDK